MKLKIKDSDIIRENIKVSNSLSNKNKRIVRILIITNCILLSVLTSFTIKYFVR